MNFIRKYKYDPSETEIIAGVIYLVMLGFIENVATENIRYTMIALFICLLIALQVVATRCIVGDVFPLLQVFSKRIAKFGKAVFLPVAGFLIFKFFQSEDQHIIFLIGAIMFAAGYAMLYGFACLKKRI
ncbi:hypothetical protein LJB93_02050 [Desulfovibrio sp. OttesenSCG-928-F07]|nr:hypothetical protein [Desulfovibrio sp. OttesenSCG-928-F07]